MIHHIPEDGQPLALQEMQRVLRLGGSLLVAEVPVAANTGHPTSPLEDVLADAGLTAIRTGEIPPWTQFAVGRNAAA